MPLVRVPPKLDRAWGPVRLTQQDLIHVCAWLNWDGGGVKLSVDHEYLADSAEDLSVYPRASVGHLVVTRKVAPHISATFHRGGSALLGGPDRWLPAEAYKFEREMSDLLQDRRLQLYRGRAKARYIGTWIFWSIFAISTVLTVKFYSSGWHLPWQAYLVNLSMLPLGAFFYFVSEAPLPDPVILKSSGTGVVGWLRKWQVELGLTLSFLSIIVGVVLTYVAP